MDFCKVLVEPLILFLQKIFFYSTDSWKGISRKSGSVRLKYVEGSSVKVQIHGVNADMLCNVCSYMASHSVLLSFNGVTD